MLALEGTVTFHSEPPVAALNAPRVDPEAANTVPLPSAIESATEPIETCHDSEKPAGLSVTGTYPLCEAFA